MVFFIVKQYPLNLTLNNIKLPLVIHLEYERNDNADKIHILH